MADGEVSYRPRLFNGERDEVWQQMAGYWAATGQLTAGQLGAWDGRSELGFYELGTLASSYGADPVAGPAPWSSPSAGVSDSSGSGDEGSWSVWSTTVWA